MERIPSSILKEPDPLFSFNRRIIDATHDLACCFKLNYAFYSAEGSKGLAALENAIEFIRDRGVPIILDAKWGDIGHTAERYAQTAFERLNVDMATLNPYMGEDSISPFRAYIDRGSFALCLTSNPSRDDFQTRKIALQRSGESADSAPMYELVAEKIRDWNANGNVGAVVGATAPEALARIRTILGPDIPILCPGVGAQGGDLEAVFLASEAGNHANLAVNVSRGVIHASSKDDFAEAARNSALKYVDLCKRLFTDAIAANP